ncbi:MAG TPA: Hsp20/alpha crystallin family protein [Solirubrobacterales bacterium]|nr:Hsp20/alpha crystallin family protein [Solirubrobacterales bacterium]
MAAIVRWSAATGTGPRRWVPAVDLVERDGQLVLRADLPGMDRDDIDVQVKDGVLTVSGERKYENENKGEGFYRVERSFGRFSRSLRLPRGVDASAVSASFDRGVLEVTVPKPSRPTATKIEIGEARPATETAQVEVPSEGASAQAETAEAHADTPAEAPAEAGAAA